MKQIDNVIGNLPFGYYLKKFWDWVLGHFAEFDSTGHQTMAEGLRPDGLYETGMTTYAWYIWKRSWRARRSEPVIRWIDNDGCVVRKGRT